MNSAACAALLWFVFAALAAVGSVGRVADASGARWRILEYSISPTARYVAEVEAESTSTQRSEAQSREILTVLSLGTPKKPPARLYSGVDVGNIAWLRDGELVFTSCARQCEIISASVNSNKKIVLKVIDGHISRLIPSPDGSLLAYQYVERRVGSGLGENWVSLKITEDEDLLNVLLPSDMRGDSNIGFRFGVVETRNGMEVVPQHSWRWNMLSPVLFWDREKLLAVRAEMADIADELVDVRTGAKVAALNGLSGVLMASASQRGEIALVSIGVDGQFAMGQVRIYVVKKGVKLREIRIHGVKYVDAVWWKGEDELILQAEMGGVTGGHVELVVVSVRSGRVTKVIRWKSGVGSLGDYFHVCSFDNDRTVAVCSAESLTSPFQMVKINLMSGSVVMMGRLDPQQEALQIDFRHILVRNRYGQSADAFLALPKGWHSHPVPLAVMMYGFNRSYSKDAQWITSYPVARFVKAGIAVLLLNFPDSGGWHSGELFAQTRRYWISEPMATVAAAVPAVRRFGVRVSRAMVMGWSHGGLIAAFAIQKLPEFVAAQVGDPQEWNVATYAIANRWWRNSMKGVFGGPPVRQYISRYLDFDPVADGRPANGPILFEFVSRNPTVGQFLAEWRAVGTSVEAFAYHRSIHWLNVPAEASISRERNLDWAELNLFGPQSVSAAELRRVGLTVPKDGWWTRVHPQ